MSDSTERMLGQVDGKLDTLMQTVATWQRDHNERHALIDLKLEANTADINKAKGAKAAIFAVAAVVSGFVGVAVAAADRIFK